MRDGGALLIDIRSDTQRVRDGLVPGALVVPRNVLEWRCDPASPHRDPRIDGLTQALILICDEGYQSSLAAATLQELGLTRTTDVIGGFRAWRDAGLRVRVERPDEPPAPSPSRPSQAASATGAWRPRRQAAGTPHV